MDPKKYVVDTNVVNWLVDGTILAADMPSDGVFVATHVQIDEINATSDADRRARLFLTLASSLSGILPTESMVADVSRWDHAKMGDGEIYSSVKQRLDELNGGRSSNIRDALIAEVCIVNSHTLLTADRDLAKATEEHGGVVTFFSAA
jgi:predicted nucleic acid-binding protein